MRGLLAWAERRYNGAMIALFCALVLATCTFYVEGLVPRTLVYADGTEIPCGTVVAPDSGPGCSGVADLDTWVAAGSLVLTLALLGAMVTLGIRRSRARR